MFKARKALVMLVVLGAMLATASAAVAAGFSSSLFGGATSDSSAVTLTSNLTDVSTTNDFSGIKLIAPAGTTFANLTQLSAEFNPTAGGCGGGSPRFSIKLSTGGDVNVAFGPSPSFTGCPLNTWQSTGNLIGNNDTGRYDTSHVTGGSPFTTYAAALALVGSTPVTEIDLVVDAGWAFTPQVQTVLVRNVVVNDQTFYAPKAPKTPNAAQLCKAEETALGKVAFEQKYGSNHNLANAFGKCVSGKAKPQHPAAVTVAAKTVKVNTAKSHKHAPKHHS